MIESAIFLTLCIAFLFLIIGFFARIQILAVAGFVFLLIPGIGILATGYELREGTITETTVTPEFYYIADEFALVTGTNSTALENVRFFNGVAANLSERVAAPGLDFRVNFTNVSTFSRVLMRFKTTNVNIQTNLQLWNYVGSEWVTFDSYVEQPSYGQLNDSIEASPNYVRNGTVQFRLLHPDNGNTNHDHIIDWVTLEQDPVTVEETTIYYEEAQGFAAVSLALALVVIAVGGLLMSVLVL